MNQHFLLSFAVVFFASIGGLALLFGLFGLVWSSRRTFAKRLLLVTLPAGLFGVLALYALANLTNTTPAPSAAGVAFLCVAGVAAIALALLRAIMRNEEQRPS